jgi:hypothetical protein
MSKPTRNLKAKIWERDKDDFYCEPFWCSAALFAAEPFENTVLDPACGLGRIVDAARSYGLQAIGTDKVRRSVACRDVVDFLSCAAPGCDIVSNPPFGIADLFVRHALAVSRSKVAMLLPATWHFGAKRAAWLKTTPLRRIYALTPRPSMPPGAVILAGGKPGGGTKDFAWYIWLRGYQGPVEACWLSRDDARAA